MNPTTPNGRPWLDRPQLSLEQAAKTLDRSQLWFMVGTGIEALQEAYTHGESNADGAERLCYDLLALAELVRLLWMLDEPTQAGYAVK